MPMKNRLRMILGCALAGCVLMGVSVRAAKHHDTPPPKVEMEPASALPHLNELTDAEKTEGWKLLFDGKSTAGWRNYKKDTISDGWKVMDGALCRVGSSADNIVSIEEFDNFTFELDYRVPAWSNSGIMFRVTETESKPPFSGIEFQILDNTDPDGDVQKAGWAYALYPSPIDEKTGKPLDTTKPPGKWNHIKLVCNGPHVEHWMNGVKYCEYEIGSDDFKQRLAKSKFAERPNFAKSPRGHITLQGDHGDVSFANIKILPMIAK